MLDKATMKPDYPYDEWAIVEEGFVLSKNYKNETVFALGNGYLGMRGSFEERYGGPDWPGLEGTYLNGFYETETIHYGETAYGFPQYSQTMLNVPNGKIIKLYLGDEEFSMMQGEVTHYRRELNLRQGVLRRRLEWCSPLGKKARLCITRLVSWTDRHLAAINYEVTPLNFDGEIRLLSALDGDVTNLRADQDPRLGSGLKGRVLELETLQCEGCGGVLTQKTKRSRLQIGCAMENQILTDNPCRITNHTGELGAEVIFAVTARQNTTITLNKFISYYTSGENAAPASLSSLAQRCVMEAKLKGFAAILEAHCAYLADFWRRSDVEIQGDPATQQGIRFNIFHLLQAAGRDGTTSIAAKGLTGEGYEGHYFWDSEMYVVPFFLYNNPEISRKLLEYRYHNLDRARERARQMSHPKGALFPWRTINGEECSAYFPAGTAQYHINADIAFAIKKYMEGTADIAFLTDYGAEILFETARLWFDLGDFIPKKGNRFCINGVTGPDEYTAIVNNNFYTNLMAGENLEYACQVAEWLRENQRATFLKLSHKIGLAATEPEDWQKAAANMYLPYDEELGLYAQDDTFFNKAVWDFDGTRSQRPLLMHFHPLVIYRYQVCKQADVLLAFHLLRHRFNPDEIRRNFDYYERITTHDSSLSYCVFGMVAADIGYYDKAAAYFFKTARMDLDDYQGNVNAGVHIANMAGTGLGLLNGMAGLRIDNDTIRLKPFIPDAWRAYCFKISYRGRLVAVTVTREKTSYQLMEGDNLTILHDETAIHLTRQTTLSVG